MELNGRLAVMASAGGETPTSSYGETEACVAIFLFTHAKWRSSYERDGERAFVGEEGQGGAGGLYIYKVGKKAWEVGRKGASKSSFIMEYVNERG